MMGQLDGRRIILIGGAGFIGHHLALKLKRLGADVTIVDSLTTRLEYVPDSAQCSVPAKFMTQENDGESLVLRWEIAEPLQVGDGGLIRFKCRVR